MLLMKTSIQVWTTKTHVNYENIVRLRLRLQSADHLYAEEERGGHKTLHSMACLHILIPQLEMAHIFSKSTLEGHAFCRTVATILDNASSSLLVCRSRYGRRVDRPNPCAVLWPTAVGCIPRRPVGADDGRKQSHLRPGERREAQSRR